MHDNGIKKLGIVLLVSLFLIPFASSLVDTVQSVKQGSCITFAHIDDESTSENITYVQNPDTTIVAVDKPMTRTGTFYNYTYCGTGKNGMYIVYGVGNPATPARNPVAWSYEFYVTPSGSLGLLGLSIVVITIIYFIAFFGFFGKNIWVAMFGGMAMILLGLYTLNNGIDIYRSFITEAFSFITMGIGATFALTAGVELIEENLP